MNSLRVIVARSLLGLLAVLLWTQQGSAQDDTVSSEVRETLRLLESASQEKRERLLTEWAQAGAENLEVVLMFARRRVTTGDAEQWSALLDYFQSIADREVDLLLSELLDADRADAVKVKVMDVLKRHLGYEAWVLPVDIRGERIQLTGLRWGWSPDWGIGPKEGTFVTFDDVHQIRDKVTAVTDDENESNVVRQRARALLAYIALRDAEMWSTRLRVRSLRGEFYNLRTTDERDSTVARIRDEGQALVEKRRRQWEEEKARTVGVDADSSDHSHSPTALPQQMQRIPSSGGSAWPYLVTGLATGLAVGAAGAWLLLRRRSGG